MSIAFSRLFFGDSLPPLCPSPPFSFCLGVLVFLCACASQSSTAEQMLRMGKKSAWGRNESIRSVPFLANATWNSARFRAYLVKFGIVIFEILSGRSFCCPLGSATISNRKLAPRWHDCTNLIFVYGKQARYANVLYSRQEERKWPYIQGVPSHF